jgi:hypothetical protein
MQSPENVVDRRSVEKTMLRQRVTTLEENPEKGATMAKSAARFLQIIQNYKVSLRVRPKPGLTYQRLSEHVIKMVRNFLIGVALASGRLPRSFKFRLRQGGAQVTPFWPG